MEQGNETYNDQVQTTFEKELTHNNNHIPVYNRRLRVLRRRACGDVAAAAGCAGAFAILVLLTDWLRRSVVDDRNYIYNVYMVAVMCFMMLYAYGFIKNSERSVNHINNIAKLCKRLRECTKNRDFAQRRIKECEQVREG